MRRSELLRAAITVIRRDGLAATMDDMAAEAGVSKPILYRHFDDRAGLIAAISESSFSYMASVLEKALRSSSNPREVVRSTVDTYLGFVEAEPEIYRFVIHAAVAEGVDLHAARAGYMASTARLVATVLREALTEAATDPAPADAWAFGIVGMVHAAGEWWLHEGTVDRAQLCEQLTALIVDGLPLGDDAEHGAA